MRKLREVWMGRITDGLKGVAGRLKQLPGGRPGKALVRVVQFFAVMVVLTIFARGAAGATMPVVETAALSQHNIRVSSDYSGTITATNKEEVKIPSGLMVEKVHVSPGSVVKEGDVLVTFDTSTLEQNLATQNIALQELQLALVELQKTVEQDDSMVVSAQKAVKSAQAGYDEARTAADQAWRRPRPSRMQTALRRGLTRSASGCWWPAASAGSTPLRQKKKS